MIKVTHLTKVYKINRFLKRDKIIALDNVSFEINNGGIYGIVGPNGSGKTTLFKILMGLVIPTFGEVKIFNLSPSDPKCREIIGYLPENVIFPKYLTPDKILKLTGRLFSIEEEKLNSKIDDLLSFVELERWRNVEVRKFSKGMVKALGLIRSLINEPKILLLDEPFEGLDPEKRFLFKEFLKNFIETDRDRIVLINTHLLSDVEKICDQVLFLYKGKLIDKVKVSKLLDKYIIYLPFDKMNFDKFASIGGLFYNKGKAGLLIEGDKLNEVLFYLESNGIKRDLIELKKADVEEIYTYLISKARDCYG
ncbi:ABC transporter ATP-binding protein [Candidatus Chrysopegis kryptomonas]|uniref:ABC-2 type transport system ATP-binding protein n=1 Tax=Candidatus Chryseopegocella kryptomonas TaxID=1633643 RepID=A0A0N7MW68_9BACT|nr:ABC transporter ATP-binding protein [Candidatus Chrysopegis kryptomonas]CUS97803.1 ABC-2 type transport system ATP-binding protein [Candidatus Chrysopegis kryptomonas]